MERGPPDGVIVVDGDQWLGINSTRFDLAEIGERTRIAAIASVAFPCSDQSSSVL